MTRLLFAPLLVAAVLLALGAAAACDNDGDSDGEDGTTPAAAVTPEVTPEESDENGTADVVTDGDPDAALRAEAEALCPAQFVEPCTDAYIAAAKGSLKSALCKTPGTPDAKWFFEPPQGEVGEACSDGETAIFAIVGGE